MEYLDGVFDALPHSDSDSLFFPSLEKNLEVKLFSKCFFILAVDGDISVSGESAQLGQQLEGETAEVVVDLIGFQVVGLVLRNDHLEETIDQFVLHSTQELGYFVCTRVGDDDLECLESSQKVVVITHQAEAVEKRLHNVSLLCKVNNVFAFQRQHYDQLSHNVGQLRDPCLVEFEKVVQHVNIDEDGMRP